MSNPKAQMCILFRKVRGSGVPYHIPLFNGKQILTPGYRHTTTNAGRVIELLEIGYRNLDWIVNNNYTLRLQEKSNDLMNAAKQMLARGEFGELAKFMDVHIQPRAIKEINLARVVDDLESHPFGYNPELAKHYLDIDIPADKDFPSSPDYSNNLEYVLYNSETAADIRLPMSGSRDVDEQAAIRFLEEKFGQALTDAEKREFVLHHKSPFLTEDGELWFVGQFVRKDVHQKLYLASLKGLMEPPDIPLPKPGLWELTFDAIKDWEGPDDPFDYSRFSRLLFGHVGAVKAYTEFYPGVFYN